MVGGGWPLLPVILGQPTPTGAKSPFRPRYAKLPVNTDTSIPTNSTNSTTPFSRYLGLPLLHESCSLITRGHCLKLAKRSSTINSSEDERANVNFLYDDIVHALQYTIDSCINYATYRRCYVLERRFTKFSEIKKYNGHYAVQGHSRSPSSVPIAHMRLPISV